MSGADDSLVDRGAAIFAQLREQVADDVDETADGPTGDAQEPEVDALAEAEEPADETPDGDLEEVADLAEVAEAAWQDGVTNRPDPALADALEDGDAAGAGAVPSTQPEVEVADDPLPTDLDAVADEVEAVVPPAEPIAETTPATPTAPPAPRPVRMPEDVLAVGNEQPRAGTSGSTAPAGAVDAAGHALPRIMAVANQKGGVGKTTTAVNLAAALADAGYRTLVVDLDPQGNASTGLGINIRDLQLSMYDVIIHEASIDDTIEATAMKNLFVAPASLDLAGAEIELVPAFSRELRLRHALDEVRDAFDYVLIDCPPSLGLLTVNGLAAASEVLVPIQCEYYALEGLGQLLRNVSLVQRNVNRTLTVSTFVCVMYDARTKLADQVVAEVREHFGEKVCRIVIPRTVRLSEAPSYGQPILAFDPRSRGAIAYRELAKEVSGGPVPDPAPTVAESGT